MRFTTLLTSLACIIGVFAQSQSAPIAFTQIPVQVSGGVPTTIEWGGGDGTPVTILLRAGDPKNLEIITTVVANANGTSYTWTPPFNLQNRTDYSLSIQQGINSINYSGQFSYTSGIVNLSSSASATTTVTANSSVTATTTYVIGASSGGTGIPMSRNTTFIGATLTTTATTAVTITGSRTAATASSTGAAVALGAAPYGLSLLAMVLYWL